MADQTPHAETYNPWTVVNVVFHHLVEQGLHPTLGDTGHPGEPAAALLRALGITPRAEGDLRAARNVQAHLAELRASMFEQPAAAADRPLSHIETRNTADPGL
ncbi:MAG: hypothetical protein ABW215_21360 [Kibdelosporangium sp.]